MTTQLELGERLRDSGAKTVLEHAGEAWRNEFNAAADELLASRGRLTSDDVVQVVGLPPNHPNAIGAAMRSWARTKGLRVVGYNKSQKTSRHAAIVAIWGATE